MSCHERPERGEVVDLEICEQVRSPDEDRVVAAAGGLECIEHLRPDRGVAAPVFSFLPRQESHREANAFHRASFGIAGPRKRRLRSPEPRSSNAG